MSTFHPVNTGLVPESHSLSSGEDTTPTTPRPVTAPQLHTHPLTRLDDATTPTRATFGAALAGQRPLPESPFLNSLTEPVNVENQTNAPVRADSGHSIRSRETEDVDMDDSEDGQSGSDEEEDVNEDGTRSTKKKKSQKFWCTDYPPCNLSFTRSEHLARHIRKHTGERPFQCHCSRRFSRLDNLRQHAQTVHVNEEIPNDSLAATGTRFQRQVRTDRIRPTGPRSRASTASREIPHIRGHHRNSLSASSIGSIGSSYSQREEFRRRPPPLVMATDHRGRGPYENYAAAPDSPSQYQAYRSHSPGGYSTPTSATFSTGQNSPRWGSDMPSPISSHSRTASIYAGNRTPGRRLSVPSGANPFQSPHGASYGPPPLTPQNASNSGLFSTAGSVMASPISSTFYSHSRRESMSSATDDLRRRTWGPDSRSGFTSRLSNVTTPGYYQPGPAPLNPQNTRLPGIESFDPLPPATPPQRAPSPMMVDTPSRAPFPYNENYARSDDRRVAISAIEHYSHLEERRAPVSFSEQFPRPDDRSHPQWEAGLHRNLTRLDIARETPPMDSAGAWASEANRAMQAHAEQARVQPTVRFDQFTYTAPPSREGPTNYQPRHHISAPPVTPREAKRRGWYHGPVPLQQDSNGQRTSPADSSSSEGGVPGTPGSATVGDYNPSIVHSSGYVEPSQRPMQPNPYPNYTTGHADMSYPYAPGSRSMAPHPVHEAPKPDSMSGLDALVAVATRDENATTAY